ncbi:MAG: FHA domain-containing protein, partial [Pseudomonadales bacterium]
VPNIDTGNTSSPNSEPKTQIYRGSTDDKNNDREMLAGWLIIVEGPGRGRHFGVGYGNNSIGRSQEARICIDTGDSEISRSNQCFVTFDPDEVKFYISSGMGVNLTKLNGTVLSAANVKLTDRDIISFGQTKIMFVALCNEHFHW